MDLAAYDSTLDATHDKMVIHKHYTCTKEVTGYEVRNALGLSKWS